MKTIKVAINAWGLMIYGEIRVQPKDVATPQARKQLIDRLESSCRWTIIGE
jgi:hypothetical protein